MKKLVLVIVLSVMTTNAFAIVVNPLRPVNACSTVAHPKACK